MNIKNPTKEKYFSSDLALLTQPPGGILMWLFVVMEILIFSAGFIAVSLLRIENPALFQQEQSHFNLSSGLIMTLCLLASGWMIAEAVHHFFKNSQKKAMNYHSTSLFFGFIFLIYKFMDFKEKADAGLTLGKNDFWDLYWLLAGFHYVHVIVGMLLLSIVTLKLRKGRAFEDDDFAIRGSGLFWHMCDLAWFFLFPIFYVRVGL